MPGSGAQGCRPADDRRDKASFSNKCIFHLMPFTADFFRQIGSGLEFGNS